MISDEGIVIKPILKGVQSKAQNKVQEDDSQCNYTTSKDTFIKEVEIENVNKECDNNYDADTENHPISELTQPQEESKISEDKKKGKFGFLSLTVFAHL